MAFYELELQHTTELVYFNDTLVDICNILCLGKVTDDSRQAFIKGYDKRREELLSVFLPDRFNYKKELAKAKEEQNKERLNISRGEYLTKLNKGYSSMEEVMKAAAELNAALKDKANPQQ